MLDCGWNETNPNHIIDNLRRHARQIDAILISHPSPMHLGLLPYAVTKLGINCPIYMTIPTCKLGQMFMYDMCQSKMATEEFDKDSKSFFLMKVILKAIFSSLIVEAYLFFC